MMKFFSVLLLIFSSSAVFAQQQNESIYITEVKTHINDSILVCGIVLRTQYKVASHTTLLIMGDVNSREELLRIVIAGKVKSKFKKAPDINLKKKYVCVSGKLIVRNEKIQIIVYSPNQIVDVAETDPPPLYDNQ